MNTRLVLAFSLLCIAGVASAQQPTNAAPSPPPGPPPPNVGDVAPDFAFRGITRFGALRDAMRIADFKGETVVLWLFVKARTRG